MSDYTIVKKPDGWRVYERSGAALHPTNDKAYPTKTAAQRVIRIWQAPVGRPKWVRGYRSVIRGGQAPDDQTTAGTASPPTDHDQVLLDQFTGNRCADMAAALAEFRGVWLKGPEWVRNGLRTRAGANLWAAVDAWVEAEKKAQMQQQQGETA
jgi:hypothetical protein